MSNTNDFMLTVPLDVSRVLRWDSGGQPITVVMPRQIERKEAPQYIEFLKLVIRQIEHEQYDPSPPPPAPIFSPLPGLKDLAG